MGSFLKSIVTFDTFPNPLLTLDIMDAAFKMHGIFYK